MNLDNIINSMLNGEVIHDGIVIGVIFICMYAFYSAIFSGIFSIFKK